MARSNLTYNQALTYIYAKLNESASGIFQLDQAVALVYKSASVSFHKGKEQTIQSHYTNTVLVLKVPLI